LGVKLSGVTAVIHAQTDYFGRDTWSQELDIAKFTDDTGIPNTSEWIAFNSPDSFVVEYAVAGLFA
jgi:hypothetical protein